MSKPLTALRHHVTGAIERGEKVAIVEQTATTDICDKPLAASGLISYRYKGEYGYIMIGARNDDDALREAYRSVRPTLVSIDRLEIWNGTGYVRLQP